VKYWEIIADNLSKVGWSWGFVSAIDSNGRTIWIADAPATTEGVSLCVRMKSWLRFLNLKRLSVFCQRNSDQTFLVIFSAS